MTTIEEMLGALTVRKVEETIKVKRQRWAHQCHAISLAIVKSGVLEQPARVARGFCPGVGGQHSWVVLGHDCYDEEATIIDATAWSYLDTDPYLWMGVAKELPHVPHGKGSIWLWGQPVAGDGPVIELTPSQPLSQEAQFFLEMLGPLDRQGWAVLSSAPVQEWPAGEIFAAMDDTEGLSALVPIDILGMTTDRNPGGLYLAGGT